MSSEHIQMCVCYDLLIASHTFQIFSNPFSYFETKSNIKITFWFQTNFDNECFNNIKLITYVYNRENIYLDKQYGFA